MTDPRFSPELPALQLIWSSHSLGAFKKCPRFYYYSIRLGLAPRRQRVDLEFGALLAKGFEVYHAARARGASHSEGLRASVHHLLRATWVNGRPLLLDDPAKNRFGLIRALIWSLHFVGPEDPLKTATLASGAPAVELDFLFDSGYRSRTTGEPFQLRGRLDRIVDFQGGRYIEDVKSSRHTLDARWLAHFSPDNQFSLYCLAGRVAWSQPIEGLIVSGVQVGVTFARGPRRALVARPEAVIDEWYEGLSVWLHQIEHCASSEADLGAAAWPQNDSACWSHGAQCDFREICSKSPTGRGLRLTTDFKVKEPT